MRARFAATDRYVRILGATEREYMRMAMPDGVIAHAEIEIGGSVIMIGDETPGGVDPSAKTLGGSPVALFVYVTDVDDVYGRAIDAGSRAVQEPQDQFYGDRVAMFDDPWGHRWNIATHVEDVSAEEMARRAAELDGAPTTSG